MKSAVDNGSFMDLWKTYSHCQNTTDFDELKQDAIALTTAATHSSSGKSSMRLAVDLKAMSASCSLRAGQAALDAHKFDITRELLQHIFKYYPKSDYAFYSSQAKAILEEIEPATIQVSSLKLP